jgi:hypothetical protein
MLRPPASRVLPFSKANLVSACTHRLRDESSCDRKPHLDYFGDHLESLGCQTIVVEDEYVDRDYLDDFAAYYALCFVEYDRFCRRLHFFATTFDAAAFSEFIASGAGVAPDALRSSYLGFVVLKPLPDAFVGRTCLLPNPPPTPQLSYPMMRDYRAHLAGLELGVRSLAFQEQDTVLAACATTALWTALHKASELFGTRMPTPAEITNHVENRALQRGRTLPSHGLTVHQMCQAIKNAGLDVELREGSRIKDVRGLIYGYGQFGLPTILGLDLRKTSAVESIGYHAVTVCGYGSGAKGVDDALSSDCINALYIHDDQCGPFAKVDLVSCQPEWDHFKG